MPAEREGSMRKLILFVLALVLLIPMPAVAGMPAAYELAKTTCEEDADQPGIFDIRSHIDMWTDRPMYKKMFAIFEEYRDYGDGWLLYRRTRDITYRSSGEIIDGFFHLRSSYHARFYPEVYDVRLDFSIWWTGLHASGNIYGTIAKKRDGGRCFAKSFGESPPGF
jgi:hypothetical protein